MRAVPAKIVRYVTYTNMLPAVRIGLKLANDEPRIAKKNAEMKINKQRLKGPVLMRYLQCGPIVRSGL